MEGHSKECGFHPSAVGPGAQSKHLHQRRDLIYLRFGKASSGCCSEKPLQRAKGGSYALCSPGVERTVAWFRVSAVEVGRGSQILDTL